MPVVPCSAEGCTWQTGDFETPIAVELLKIHAAQHVTAPPPAPAVHASARDVRQKPPKLKGPTISRGTTEEEWNIIKRK